MPAFNSYWITLAVCGVLSFIFYLFIMITMLRYRQSNELKSPFFKIWISLGVADCLHFLHSYILMRLPLLGVFSSFYKAHVNGFLPKCALMGTYYFLFVQLFGNLLFALNRYTALTKLGRHEQVWRLLTIIINSLCNICPV
jgi:amino acid transporter